jgi:hypothetical protein
MEEPSLIKSARELTAYVADIIERRDDALADVGLLANRINELEAECNRLDGENNEMSDEISSLKARIAELETQRPPVTPPPPPPPVDTDLRIVSAHEMLAMPPRGGGTSDADILARLKVAKAMGIDVVNLFHIEAFQPVAKRYYDMAEKAGIKVRPCFGYIGQNDLFRLEEVLPRFHVHPAQHMIGGRSSVTAYHGSEVVALQLSQPGWKSLWHYVPHMFCRTNNGGSWDSGGVMENMNAELVMRLFREGPPTEGFAMFAPVNTDLALYDWFAEAARKTGRYLRASITPQHVPVGNGRNWRVVDGNGYAWLFQQWAKIISLRDVIREVEYVTLNDASERTHMMGYFDPARVVSNHWNWAEWPELTARNGFASYSKHFAEWFKTGREPEVTKTEAWVCHRMHPKNAVVPLVENSQRYGDAIDTGSLQDLVHVCVRTPHTEVVEINGTPYLAKGTESRESHFSVALPAPGQDVVVKIGGVERYRCMVHPSRVAAFDSVAVKIV